MPGQVTTPIRLVIAGESRHDTILTKHIQGPSQVYAHVVQHGTESGGEGCEEDDTKMACTDNLAVGSVSVEILAIDVEAKD